MLKQECTVHLGSSKCGAKRCFLRQLWRCELFVSVRASTALDRFSENWGMKSFWSRSWTTLFFVLFLSKIKNCYCLFVSVFGLFPLSFLFISFFTTSFLLFRFYRPCFLHCLTLHFCPVLFQSSVSSKCCKGHTHSLGGSDIYCVLLVTIIWRHCQCSVLCKRLCCESTIFGHKI